MSCESLVYVRFGVGEGSIRVCFVMSIDLLQILAFGVSIRQSNWLAFDVVILTSSFGLFYSKVIIPNTLF